jgi:hypothetical protein
MLARTASGEQIVTFEVCCVNVLVLVLAPYLLDSNVTFDFHRRVAKRCSHRDEFLLVVRNFQPLLRRSCIVGEGAGEYPHKLAFPLPACRPTKERSVRIRKL